MMKRGSASADFLGRPRVVRGVCLFMSLSLLAGCPAPPTGNSNTNSVGNQNGNGTSNTNGSGTNTNAGGVIPAPTAATITLLNEVRFNPDEGEFQFVELKASSTGLASGLVLVNEAGAQFALPAGLPVVHAGQLLVVQFDAQTGMDGAIIHAGQTNFLNRTSGSVTLQDLMGTIFDRVSWGPDRIDSAPLGGGGLLTENPVGVLIRRGDSTTENAVQDWTLVAPPLATPGQPNPNPSLGQLFPLDSSLQQAGDIQFSWFPIAGAIKYRVQVSNSEAFDSTVVDETVERPPVIKNLPAGDYFWRVQAVFVGDSPADFSTANELTLVEDLAAVEAQAEAEVAATAKPRNTSQLIRTRVSVPRYAQRKDTKLLLLETDYPTGTRQAWNAPHPDTDETDPADNTNCAIASISMVNGFLANAGEDQANLSQDRISYEIFTKRVFADGLPEHDFNYGRGLFHGEVKFGLQFATQSSVADFQLGAADVASVQRRNVYSGTAFREQFWNALIASIQNNRPVQLGHWTGSYGTYAHAIVATGYYTFRGERYVRFNDPWHGQFDRMKLSRMLIIDYFILPGSGESAVADEPELRAETDDDHDRVLDWDERMRFHTFADKKDSDGDCVEDFDEIELSVFDERHGWGRYWADLHRHVRHPMSDAAARRYRERGQEAPELDEDSDGGGLPDFVEDLNRNGQIERDKGETDPFDPMDDARKITGTLKRVLDRVEPGFHSVQTRDFTFDLHSNTDEITGTILGTWNSNYVRELSADPPECPNPRTLTATYDTVQANMQAEVEFVCNPNEEHPLGPGMIIREKEPVFQFAQQVTFVDECRGTTRSLPTPPNFSMFVSWPLSPVEGQFFTGPNGRVQFKARVSSSSLPIEAASYNEWDIVMERP